MFKWASGKPYEYTTAKTIKRLTDLGKIPFDALIFAEDEVGTRGSEHRYWLKSLEAPHPVLCLNAVLNEDLYNVPCIKLWVDGKEVLHTRFYPAMEGHIYSTAVSLGQHEIRVLYYDAYNPRNCCQGDFTVTLNDAVVSSLVFWQGADYKTFRSRKYIYLGDEPRVMGSIPTFLHNMWNEEWYASNCEFCGNEWGGTHLGTSLVGRETMHKTVCIQGQWLQVVQYTDTIHERYECEFCRKTWNYNRQREYVP